MDSVKNYVIGYWNNPQGQQFCTVIVKTDDIQEAKDMMFTLQNEERSFSWSPIFKRANLSVISDEELHELQNSNDIYNQVDIIEFNDFLNIN